MELETLSTKAGNYLRRLCLEIPDRRVGSDGNRAATDYFASQMASFGFAVETPSFDCMDWVQEGARLSSSGEEFEVHPGPYSLGYNGQGLLVAASTLDELQALSVAGKILLLRGELAKEQLMPKNFPFYNPDEHKQIIALLEAQKPVAIVAATTRNPEMAGALYPFPLFEDGDFDIPSVYTTEEQGARLAERVGELVSLEIHAQRIPAQASNVVARRGPGAGSRVVFCAHIDAKDGSPGALDNAAGVAVLLLLGELLADFSGGLDVEIVAINGEDYYSNPGEQLYLSQNEGRFVDILLAVNLDGLGYRRGKTAYSLYEVPPALATAVEAVFSAHPDFVQGEPWYQGDHSLFLMNGAPALAITSERVAEIMSEIVHTKSDRPENVDPARLATTALALRGLVQSLERR